MTLKLVGAVYALMSVVTLAVYGWDKSAARAKRRRIRESTLQGLALFGGWPGALVGQALFRHKRRKTGFMFVFVCICALHVGVWGWIIVQSS